MNPVVYNLEHIKLQGDESLVLDSWQNKTQKSAFVEFETRKNSRSSHFWSGTINIVRADDNGRVYIIISNTEDLLLCDLVKSRSCEIGCLD